MDWKGNIKDISHVLHNSFTLSGTEIMIYFLVGFHAQAQIIFICIFVNKT